MSGGERQIHDILYMQNKKDTNEPIYKIETDSQRMNVCLAGGKGSGQGETGRLGLRYTQCCI